MPCRAGGARRAIRARDRPQAEDERGRARFAGSGLAGIFAGALSFAGLSLGAASLFSAWASGDSEGVGAGVIFLSLALAGTLMLASPVVIVFGIGAMLVTGSAVGSIAYALRGSVDWS